ncbi:MAG: hypothetical protein KDB37_01185 [Ilumatobacter sp.]|nr:hypothetical protein [Ilumatobacter sp.]
MHDPDPTADVGDPSDEPVDATPVETADDTLEGVAGDESDDSAVRDSEPDRPIAWTRVDWWWCLGIVVLSLVLTGLHVRAYPTLSPVDELQHVDYMIRAGEFDIPRRNERVGAEAMAEAACRSVDAPLYVGPPCGLDEYDPENFQERGFNTSAGQFPPYYVVTGVVANALTTVGVVGSKVTAGRMLGALWAAGAWIVVWYVMSLFGIDRVRRAIVVGGLMATPFVIFHAGATINADVSLMATGSLALLATVQYDRDRLRWWWLPPIFVGAFFVEATNILAITVCVTYLAIRAVGDRSLDWPRRLAPLAAFPFLYLLRVEIGPWVQDTLFPPAAVTSATDLEVSAPMFEAHRTTGVSWSRVFEQLGATFSPLRGPYLSPPLRSDATVLGLQLSNWLMIALMFAAAFLVVRAASLTLWARVLMLALLAAGPFYTFYYAYFNNSDFSAPARFALPLVPLMAVVTASALRTRDAILAASGVFGFVALTTFVQLLAAQ